jgi:hypothetical protein
MSTGAGILAQVSDAGQSSGNTTCGKLDDQAVVDAYWNDNVRQNDSAYVRV